VVVYGHPVDEARSVLVVTGAAATGKSTIGDHLRGRSGLVVIDGDVLGRGAAATAYGRRDDVGFWRHALAVCREVRTNGLVPVVPCICLPEQVLAAVDDEVVHFLALLSDPATVRRRINGRRGVSDVPSPESHVEHDRRLQQVTTVPAPHTWTTYDVTAGDVRRTREAGAAWAGTHVA
jgi:adenylate kinase